MLHLARLSISRPKPMLALWVVIGAVVALLGRSVWWPTRGPAETVDRREEQPSARPEIAATGSAAR